MKFVGDIAAGAAAALLVASAADRSWRGFISVVVATGIAVAIYQRRVAIWWLGCGWLVLSLGVAIRDSLHGPRTAMGFACSLIAILTTALLLSWWSRQRSYFQASAR